MEPLLAFCALACRLYRIFVSATTSKNYARAGRGHSQREVSALQGSVRFPSPRTCVKFPCLRRQCGVREEATVIHGSDQPWQGCVTLCAFICLRLWYTPGYLVTVSLRTCFCWPGRRADNALTR